MKLTDMNYYSLEANRHYWSVSQFKSFHKCEALGLAEINGEYEREETVSLLVGSYIDSYFTGDLDVFIEQHPELEYIKVSWTPELTDISPLLTLQHLRAACVSNNMQSAIRSLGDEYGFELEIE